MRLSLAVVLLFMSGPAQALAPAPALPPARSEQVLDRARSLGLAEGPEGGLVYQRRDESSGAVAPVALTPAQAERMTRMLAMMNDRDFEPELAQRLWAFLSSRPRDPGFEALLFTTDAQGRRILTGQGKAFLMDMLLASDGDLGRRPPPNPQHLRAQPPGGGQPQDGPAPLAPVAGAAPALQAPDHAFDGSGYRLGAFDWTAFDPVAAAPGGPAVAALAEDYAVNAQENTVRVLVSAGPASTRLRFDDGRAREEAFRQAGLDPALFAARGARLLRSLGDPRNGLLVLDVPLPQAAALGQRLQEQGVESRPSRVYQAVSAAFTQPPAALLGVQFLPIPGLGLGSIFLQADRIRSRLALDVDALHRLPGGQGQQALVGIIDSGLFASHPDFRDRVQSYTDLTPEADRPETDRRDRVGHGTHVAGIVGSSGEGGGPQGAAPQARLKVAKVFYKVKDFFGREVTRTTEDILLAAMHWMEDGQRPDVLNLSLGSPAVRINADPLIQDPLSVAVNRAVAQNGTLVVVAAGNDGSRGPSTVGRPASATYAFPVAATDNNGARAFYSSYGPVLGIDGKPISPGVRITGRGGGIDLDLVRRLREEARRRAAGQNPHEFAPLEAAGRCIYGPGVLATRSPDDGQPECALAGNPGYRYMSGTSMATPQITGMAADIVSYYRGATGRPLDPFEVQALMMETADDLRLPVEQQGAGLANGERIAAALAERVAYGIPVGNIAYGLALRLTSSDRQALGRQSRYVLTPLGLWDTRSGHLVNREEDLRAALEELRRPAPSLI